jgi:hypothetical protein
MIGTIKEKRRKTLLQLNLFFFILLSFEITYQKIFLNLNNRVNSVDVVIWKMWNGF